MSEILRETFIPATQEEFAVHIRTNSKLPPLSLPNLRLELLLGDERKDLGTPSTGEASLLIRYREKEGAIASVSLPDLDLSVVQLQGSTQEGYRVNTSLIWTSVFADKLLQMARHPKSYIRRLTMPTFHAIVGYVDSEETAMQRYKEFAARAGLNLSDEEHIWVRDVR